MSPNSAGGLIPLPAGTSTYPMPVAKRNPPRKKQPVAPKQSLPTQVKYAVESLYKMCHSMGVGCLITIATEEEYINYTAGNADLMARAMGDCVARHHDTYDLIQKTMQVATQEIIAGMVHKTKSIA